MQCSHRHRVQQKQHTHCVCMGSFVRTRLPLKGRKQEQTTEAMPVWGTSQANPPPPQLASHTEILSVIPACVKHA